MNRGKRSSALALCLGLCLGLFPTAGAREAGRTVTVSTPRDLIELAKSCTLDTWSEGVTVVLAADVDLSGAEFSPIPVFCGTFEGNGHRITGLSLTGKGSDLGLIRYLRPGAVVRDLEVEGVLAPGGTKSGIGLLCGRNEGTVTGCIASGSVEGEEDVGGLVGVNEQSGVIRRCTGAAAVTGVTHTGGIAGRNEGTIDSSTNRGSLNGEANDAAQDTGGIAGLSSGTITACVNHGELGYPHSGYNVGGIAGRQSGSVVGCENRGAIRGRKDVGGVVGQFEPDTVFTYGEDPMRKLSDELAKLSGLMTRLSDQVSDYSGDAVDDLQEISGAVDHIRDTANLAGTDGGEDAREAVRLVYDQGRIVNTSLSRLLSHVDEFSASADKSLTEIGDALDELRDVLDEGLGDMDGALRDARNSLDWSISDIESQADRISGGISDIGDYLDALGGVVEAAAGLAAGGSLADVSDAVDRLRGRDIQGAFHTISRAIKSIQGDVTALRRDLGDALEDFDEAANDAWDGAAAALDRVSGAADRLESALKGFSDAATGDLGAVNDALGEMQDVLRAWLDALGGKGGNAMNSADAQLQYIHDRVGKLTDGASSANRDLHATTGDIISQLDAVRSAITDLGKTPEKTVDDVSDAVEQEGERGRVISCSNTGEISGDANVGGIAGILATELGLDPEEDLDVEPEKILVDTTATIKATVRACRNEGGVTARNDCAGGIVGRGEVGAVLDCFNGGSVETASGSRCGGVAGLSRTVIRRSYALCLLTGGDQLGGVAGEGHDLRDCYSMVTLVGDGEQQGAVAGTADGELAGNYFVRESLAGVDGVDYAGKAEPMDYAAFAAVEGLPEEFLGLRVTFAADGRAVKTLTVPYGGDLDAGAIPAVPERDGLHGAWEDFDRTHVTRGRTVEAVYSDWAATIATGEDQPVLLLEGAFAPEAVLRAEDWTPEAGLIPAGYELVAGYTYAVDAGGEREPEAEITVRVRCGGDAGSVRAAVLRDGALTFVEAGREGSYLVFPLAAEGAFVLLAKPGVQALWLVGGVSALALAAAVLLVVRKKKSQKKTPAGV